MVKVNMRGKLKKREGRGSTGGPLSQPLGNKMEVEVEVEVKVEVEAAAAATAPDLSKAADDEAYK